MAILVDTRVEQNVSFGHDALIHKASLRSRPSAFTYALRCVLILRGWNSWMSAGGRCAPPAGGGKFYLVFFIEDFHCYAEVFESQKIALGLVASAFSKCSTPAKLKRSVTHT